MEQVYKLWKMKTISSFGKLKNGCCLLLFEIRTIP